MVFSSHAFLFYFLPLAIGFYYVVPRRGRHLVLTLGSYLFYGWANPLFVVLLLASTVVDYVCGLALVGVGPVWLARLVRAPRTAELWASPLVPLSPDAPRSPRQRLALWCSVVTNLSLLGFFKYFNFAAENVAAVASWLGVPGLELDRIVRVTLPLGISFYTFQSMSYTIDIYRGRVTPLRNLIDFACYVSMFPQLVAGPIIRFSEVADQLVRRSHTVAKFSRGIAFVSLGLAKKVLLANPCGSLADVAFGAGSITPWDAWYGVTAYAFQIYFDFSGYSDMAIGLGLMLGFVFPKNFDSPYVSASITEFWRRWHISLSTWLRDYLYIPLGGNRRGELRTYANLGVVMLLGGLWHGAAWTFVAWGGIHGLLLALERWQGKDAWYRRLPRPARVAVTFFIVLITWVFFRSPDFPSAARYLGHMFGAIEPEPAAALVTGILYQPYYLTTFAVAAAVTWMGPQSWDWTRSMSEIKVAGIFALLVVAAGVLATQAYNPFIYFIF
ncbi:MAG TPA: MBOAT family protein [Vicinamibacteria bacterium]|nr:MBOAT family protein [Vicinamibacteria bacterium]